VPRDLRRFALPLICAFAAEGLLILVLSRASAAAAPASLLFLLEAGILGFVFGGGPGALAAIAPVAVFGVVDAATCSGSDCGSHVAIVLFLMLLLGFTAGMVGALRRRYGRPPR
jgi:Na+/serine symporter